MIGKEGALPWRLSTDLKRFKQLTLGKPVIMGRATWDSLGKPLPGRPNLVVSRSGAFRAADAWAFSDLEAALAAGRAMAQRSGAQEACVIGGAALFEACAPRADRFYLTDVEAEPEGDVTLAPFDETGLRQTHRETVPAGPHDDFPSVFRVLERAS